MSSKSSPNCGRMVMRPARDRISFLARFAFAASAAVVAAGAGAASAVEVEQLLVGGLTLSVVETVSASAAPAVPAAVKTGEGGRTAFGSTRTTLVLITTMGLAEIFSLRGDSSLVVLRPAPSVLLRVAPRASAAAGAFAVVGSPLLEAPPETTDAVVETDTVVVRFKRSESAPEVAPGMRSLSAATGGQIEYVHAHKSVLHACVWEYTYT